MNAIDTNILIRYLTQDDVKQGEAAQKIIEDGAPVFLTHIVFIEAVWVLTASYGLDRRTITKVLHELTSSGFFIIDKSHMISRALQDYQKGFDFADMVIGYCGESKACNTTYTFDKKASSHAVFTLLST